MKILSIDVGLKNLSYCVFVVSDERVYVEEWKNITVLEGKVKKTELETMVEHVIDALNGEKFEADLVLIENQPMLKNGLMKTVSVVIYTYFKMMSIQTGDVGCVKFVSATNKLKCSNNTEIDSSMTYKDRKQMSIQLATKYMSVLCPDRVDWFKEQKKKDDLADAMCQGIYYIEKRLKININI